MKFSPKFTESAKEDLRHFSAHDQKIILDGIRRYLQDSADIESGKRKRLRTNELAAWELKLGTLRVFYNPTESGIVEIIAIGFKVHNDLFIKGERVDL